MRNKRRLDDVESKIGPSEKAETWAEEPLELEESQAEVIAKAIIAKRCDHASTEEIKADLGEDTYNEAKAGLVEDLMSEDYEPKERG